MPMELVRNLPYDHPYRWDGTLFGGPKLWRPTEISTALWLDAEDTSTITLNGSTVSQLADKSGNGRNAAQATATAQPTYNATGINSKPSLIFDGVDDSLSTVANLGISGNSLFTIVAVHNVLSTAAYLCPFSFGGTGAGNAFHWMITNAGAPNMWAGFDNSTQLGIVSLSSITSPFIVSMNRTSTVNSSWRIRQNGSELSVTSGNTATVNLTSAPFNIGRYINGVNYANINFGEIVVIPSSLDTLSMQKLEGYLAWKWGLEASLPSDHPYKLLPPVV
jgi:hypothetical protein